MLERNRQSTRLSRPRRGGVLIEMALVMPVLLALILGGVEYGYAFYVKNTLQAAAREAARVAILPDSTAGEVADAADNVVAPALPSLVGKVQVSPINPASYDSGDWIEVTVQCTWGDTGITALPAAMGGISPAKVLKATAVMRKE